MAKFFCGRVGDSFLTVFISAEVFVWVLVFKL